MKRTVNQPDNSTEKKSFFEYFTEIIGWIQIVVSPLMIGLILGAIVYFSKPNRSTFVIAIIITIIGLCIGVVWATKVWKKKGTTQFMSGTMATPELDKKDEDEK